MAHGIQRVGDRRGQYVCNQKVGADAREGGSSQPLPAIDQAELGALAAIDLKFGCLETDSDLLA